MKKKDRFSKLESIFTVLLATADHWFHRRPYAKNSDQSINSFDLEGKLPSQFILVPWAHPQPFCKTAFD
jgi:hypothetical protein